MDKSLCFIMPTLVGGGAERVVCLLANHFVTIGINVSIVLMKGKEIEYDIDRNVKIISKYATKENTPLNQIRIIRKLMKRDSKMIFISFLSYQNLYTIIASLGLENRVIVSLRNDPSKVLDNKKLLQYSQKILYYFADKIVFQTRDAMDWFPKYAMKKGEIILNPLLNTLPRKNFSIKKFEIVTYCRLEKQKNLSMAIRAFGKFSKEFDKYRYVIYGKGSEKGNLIKLIQEENLIGKVEIKDFDHNIFNKVVNSSMFILPSDYEGLSNSMLEAMAMGLPVICTDCPIGGAKMVIDQNENGIMINIGDEQALYESMKRIALDDNFSVKLSSNALKIREKLKIETICDQWYKLLNVE